MPTNKAWVMNCLLLGAKTTKLLQEGKEDEAREEIRSLTSELSPEDIDYLVMRLTEEEG